MARPEDDGAAGAQERQRRLSTGFLRHVVKPLGPLAVVTLIRQLHTRSGEPSSTEAT